ncbi:unnamed protein product [Cuscuta epithymum]|uniref:non-specific serine/threonine protein kinase n=1 Tax=Cuscuta epithymum TaxID=186058 RepID=A0AAV0GHK6_9ASTE|nr:unnamed protein product [Cuscuta epithymum]
MKKTSCYSTFHQVLLILVSNLLPCLVSSLTCQRTCGSQVIRYPFGTGPGCGDPRFEPYVTCNSQQQVLRLGTRSGCYPVTAIDYEREVIYISDPSMSTCSCTPPSRGFSLDGNAPFSFYDSTVFALLGCSGGVNSSSPVCDSQAAPICDLLYSCQPITSRVNNIQVSGGCCVYAPMDLGPAFQMDLEKLQCAGYSAMYSGGDGNPLAWKYGIALKYKFNYNNDYPDLCESCEKSNGVCGYSVQYRTFLCNCPGGFNSSSTCFIPALSDGSQRLRGLSWKAGGILVGVILGLLKWT